MLALAKRLAAGAPPAVNQLVKQALATAFDYSTALEMTTLRSEDHKEALRAVRERRTPRFKGR